jgi:SAM-dependent methyltransferase
MNQATNDEQTRFWNDAPGRNWVDHQETLDTIHASINALLLSACAAAPGDMVLDIGCGAGASSFALAGEVGPAGRVLGVDISQPLLERADRRKIALGATNTTFVLADAQTYSFSADSFDLVASRFGVMFFSDSVAAFRNIASGMRAGGRIVFVAWAGPEANPWFRVPQEIATARFGPAAPTSPEAPGPMAFQRIDRVCGILRDAGLVNAEGRYIETELHHPGGVAAVMALVGHVGPVARFVREKNLKPEDVSEVLSAVAAGFAPFQTKDGVRIPAGINLYTAEAR